MVRSHIDILIDISLITHMMDVIAPTRVAPIKITTMKKHTRPSIRVWKTILATTLLPTSLLAETQLQWSFADQTPETQIKSVSSTGSSQITLSAPVAFEPTAIQTQKTVSADFQAAARQMLRSEGKVQPLEFGENQPFTIEVWFQYRSTSPGGRAILSNRAFRTQDPALPGITLLIRGTNSPNANGLGAFLDFGDKDVFLTSTEPLTPNTWHHVAVRRDAEGKLDIVLDGKSVKHTGPGHQGAVSSPQSMFVGRIANNATEDSFFDGVIQSIRVSDQFLYARDFMPNQAE